jgi:hypothetical protein
MLTSAHLVISERIRSSTHNRLGALGFREACLNSCLLDM